MSHCPKCNTNHDKPGIFCSRKCANSRIWNANDKKKKSESAKNSIHVINLSKRLEKEKLKLTCDNCLKDFFVYPSDKDQHFCSKNCWIKFPNKGIYFKSKMGGYRTNSGRGKCGWYKGYFCQSSWELAWVIYQIDHKINFVRNTKGFVYQFQDKLYKFYPDFKLEHNNEYVEVKGYVNEKTKAKFVNFPFKLTVIGKTDISKYISYVTEKYGKDFISVYERT